MNTVHVACKLPMGMILELGKPGTDAYKKVTLKGANNALIQDKAGGFGLTEIDKEFWDKWSAKFAWLPAVKTGIVFACEERAAAQAESLNRDKVLSGLEPLDSKKTPKGIEKFDPNTDAPKPRAAALG